MQVRKINETGDWVIELNTEELHDINSASRHYAYEAKQKNCELVARNQTKNARTIEEALRFSPACENCSGEILLKAGVWMHLNGGKHCSGFSGLYASPMTAS